MLREQLARLAEDTSASVRITPPPPCRTKKPGITVSRSRRISLWRSPSGAPQAARSSVGKPPRRNRAAKNAAQRCNVDERRRPWSRPRQRPGGQNASALPRKRHSFDATLLMASRCQRSCPCDVFMAPTCRSHGWGLCCHVLSTSLFLRPFNNSQRSSPTSRIVPAPIIELGRRRVRMPGGGLHVL